MNEVQIIELLIPAESQFVAQARRFITDAAGSAPWMDPERLDDVRLVASETVTNALRAQRNHDLAGQISVRCELHEDYFEFSVADQAGGFERPVDRSMHADPGLHREGGFGLPLIEALSDEAHFSNVDGGTVVRLVVYRSEALRRHA